MVAFRIRNYNRNRNVKYIGCIACRNSSRIADIRGYWGRIFFDIHKRNREIEHGIDVGNKLYIDCYTVGTQLGDMDYIGVDEIAGR